MDIFETELYNLIEAIFNKHLSIGGYIHIDMAGKFIEELEDKILKLHNKH